MSFNVVWSHAYSSKNGNKQWTIGHDGISEEAKEIIRLAPDRITEALRTHLNLEPVDWNLHVLILDNSPALSYQPKLTGKRSSAVPKENGPDSLLLKVPKADLLVLSGTRGMGANLHGLQDILQGCNGTLWILSNRGEGGYIRRVLASDLLAAIATWEDTEIGVADTAKLIVTELLTYTKSRLALAIGARSGPLANLGSNRNSLGDKADDFRTEPMPSVPLLPMCKASDCGYTATSPELISHYLDSHVNLASPTDCNFCEPSTCRSSIYDLLDHLEVVHYSDPSVCVMPGCTNPGPHTYLRQHMTTYHKGHSPEVALGLARVQERIRSKKLDAEYTEQPFKHLYASQLDSEHASDVAADASPKAIQPQVMVSFPKPKGSPPAFGWASAWSALNGNGGIGADEWTDWVLRLRARAARGIRSVFGIGVDPDMIVLGLLDGCSGQYFQPKWIRSPQMPQDIADRYGAPAFVAKLPSLDYLFLNGIRALGTNIAGLVVLLKKMKPSAMLLVLSNSRKPSTSYLRPLSVAKLIDIMEKPTSWVNPCQTNEERSRREIELLSQARLSLSYGQSLVLALHQQRRQRSTLGTKPDHWRILSEEEEKSPSTSPCPSLTCSETFSGAGVVLHYLYKHGNKQNPACCVVCNRQYRTPAEMRAHCVDEHKQFFGLADDVVLNIDADEDAAEDADADAEDDEEYGSDGEA